MILASITKNHKDENFSIFINLDWLPINPNQKENQKENTEAEFAERNRLLLFFLPFFDYLNSILLIVYYRGKF